MSSPSRRRCDASSAWIDGGDVGKAACGGRRDVAYCVVRWVVRWVMRWVVRWVVHYAIHYICNSCLRLVEC